MEYLKEILSFIAWPVLIFVSYKIAFWAIKYFEKNYQKTE
jgi:hypothetical protein